MAIPGSLQSTAACIFLLVALFDVGCSRTRDYYIAAVEKDWNFAPTGWNNVKGVQLEHDRQVKSLEKVLHP